MVLSTRVKGLFIAIAGVLILSPDALLIKLVDHVDLWTLVFWRNLFVSIYLLVYLFLFERKNIFTFFQRKGLAGLCVGVCNGITGLSFVLSIIYNPAANILVIISTTPLVTGFLSFFLLKEKLEKDTIAALAVCFIGILILLWEDMGTADSLWSYALVLPLLIFLPLQLVVIRKSQKDRLFPCMIYGTIFNMLNAFFLKKEGVGVSWEDLGIIFFNACFVSGLSFSLLLSAPKYIPATWTSMIFLLETVVGSYLVWFFIEERISTHTLAGSAMVLITLFLYFLYRAKPRQTNQVKKFSRISD